MHTYYDWPCGAMRLVGMREFGAVPVIESLRLIYGIIYKKLKITIKKKNILKLGMIGTITILEQLSCRYVGEVNSQHT